MAIQLTREAVRKRRVLTEENESDTLSDILREASTNGNDRGSGARVHGRASGHYYYLGMQALIHCALSVG